MTETDRRATEASSLRGLWNSLLFRFNIDICTDKLKECGLTDVRILKLLMAYPKMKVKDMIDILKIPNSTMTHAINRLVKRRLMERQLDPKDLRSFELRITSDGREAIEEHLTEEDRLFRDMLSGLDESESAEFIRLFKKIVDHKDKKEP